MSAAPRRRLLLLGGGHAHVQVLDVLARAPLAGVQATLVTPFARQMYSGMVPGLVAGHYAAQDCSIALAPLAAAAGVQLQLAAAVALDAAARRVSLSDGRVLDYELLSLDIGAQMDRDAIPGAREHALFVRPIEDFIARVGARPLLGARGNLAVVGGGAAGVELAMALAWRLRQAGDDSRVSLVAGAAWPLPDFAPRVQRRALCALAALGVTLWPQRCVVIEADHLRLTDGTCVACDLPLLAIGTSAPRWLAGSGLALDREGFIATGATLQSLSHAEVFAAGDVASRRDEPRPKSGVHAVRAGPPLAANLQRWLEGMPLLTHRPQTRALYLLSCGERRAIAAWGGWSAEGRWVWRWKDHIDRGFVARYTRPATTA
jgi:pyridine nucleotide-disulfide oxidoreductase family protein